MLRRTLTNRLRILSAFVGLIGLLLLARVYYIQIVKADFYTERAERQYIHTQPDVYSRGSILFTTRDGEKVSAAAIQGGFLLAANPSDITDAKAFCSALLPYLTITESVCVERASLPKRTYVVLEPKLSVETMKSIEALDLTGALLYENQWRYYPGGQVAARSIGFVGYSDETEGELRGKFGLERYYDDVLFRKGESVSVNFFAELFSDVGALLKQKETEKNGDVVTSLEPSVSRLLDTILMQTNDTYNSRMTGGIIMDPKTGAIYAMNVVPSFNLNEREKATIEQFRNPLVEDVYEFGSTIKALTVAAGLDSGVITPRSTYYDSGSLTLNEFTIKNFDGRGRGTVPMQEILNQSLNTGVSYIVSQMGKERFRDYFMAYKLGSESGIDLPNETYGLVDNLNSPRDVEYATASFGQGIALTPVATIRALASLANGGTLVTPHIASRIEYDDGTFKDIRYPEGERVLSEKTSEEISRMLSIVVDDALRKGAVALPNYSIGAKTGTAQIPDPTNGGYYEDRYLHSFFGYFPVFEPKFIVFLYTVEPKNVKYASETLTDPFMEITRFLINYYSIPPDR
jgi:cell division protein FtsI (penicillin-binding protein 3)